MIRPRTGPDLSDLAAAPRLNVDDAHRRVEPSLAEPRPAAKRPGARRRRVRGAVGWAHDGSTRSSLQMSPRAGCESPVGSTRLAAVEPDAADITARDGYVDRVAVVNAGAAGRVRAGQTIGFPSEG